MFALSWTTTAIAAAGLAAIVYFVIPAKEFGPFLGPEDIGVPITGSPDLDDDLNDSSPTGNDAKYDFVIIGGGTAAMVLASRLTERKDLSILVLEAGQSSKGVQESMVPAAFYLLQRTLRDWGYRTVPQPGCGNREMQWTRTKMLGGCSSGNAMMFHLGAPGDYDAWSVAQKGDTGAAGWAYQEFQRYLRKFENFVPYPSVGVDETKRGSDGPVQTGYFGFFTEAGRTFLKSCQSIGIPLVNDVNTSAGTMGVTRTPTYIDSAGRRVSTESAYLTSSVLSRPNLTVATGAHVTKIHFINKRAVGVEYTSSRGGQMRLVKARKEIILSAGAINTPQILLLSGIGPPSDLKALDIPIIQPLEGVGKHLTDHLVFNLRLPVKKAYSLQAYLKPEGIWEGLLYASAILRWMILKDGPLTGNSQEAFAFLNIGDKDEVQEGRPDLEVMVSGLAWEDHGHGDFDVREVMSLSPTLLRPTSFGVIKLASKDPFEAPLIDPRYLTTKHDVEIFVRAIRLADRLAHTEPLKSCLDHDRRHPLLDHDLAGKSDEAIEEVVRSRVETLYHPSCTARMAPLEDEGVVDTQLNVYGVQGLRVVDASVQTEIVSGHTAGPTIAIAEKAADMIKDCWPLDAI